MHGMERHSTSPPCGNLVDGLPHDCHRETVAKPGRLGPAQNGKPMQKMSSYQGFNRCNVSRGKENLVKGMLKVNRDVIKYGKRNATTRLMIFHFLGTSKKSKKL